MTNCPMSNIDKRAELRKELSNPANGSNAHLRKLALALLDELEAKDKLNAELMEKHRLIDICQGQGVEHRIAAEKRAEDAEKRIAEQRETLLAARSYVMQCARWGDAHANGVLQAIDRAAGQGE